MASIDLKDALKELLEMSKTQERDLQSGRLADALVLSDERERLIEMLKSDGVTMADNDSESRELISQILESDKRLSLMATERVSTISEKLKKRAEAKEGIEAYNKGITAR